MKLGVQTLIFEMYFPGQRPHEQIQTRIRAFVEIMEQKRFEQNTTLRKEVHYMGIVAGIDVGSLTAKAVIMNDGEILASKVIKSGLRMKNAGTEVLDQTLQEAGIGIDQLAYIVATGYGRVTVPSAKKVVTEIACHTAGIHFLFQASGPLSTSGARTASASASMKKAMWPILP